MPGELSGRRLSSGYSHSCTVVPGHPQGRFSQQQRRRRGSPWRGARPPAGRLAVRAGQRPRCLTAPIWRARSRPITRRHQIRPPNRPLLSSGMSSDMSQPLVRGGPSSRPSADSLRAVAGQPTCPLKRAGPRVARWWVRPSGGRKTPARRPIHELEGDPIDEVECGQIEGHLVLIHPLLPEQVRNPPPSGVSSRRRSGGAHRRE